MEYISKQSIEKVLQRLNSSNRHKQYKHYIDGNELICKSIIDDKNFNFAPADKIIDIEYIELCNQMPKVYIEFDTRDQEELEDSFYWILRTDDIFSNL